MDTTVPRIRVESPERWQSALMRALDAGIHVYQVSGTGQWVATSASKPGVCFAVTTDECQCEAAMLGGDAVCLHRAALRCELGLLWPEAPASCPTCKGERRIKQAGFDGWDIVPCPACQGARLAA
jgi:hypothetical protein